MKNRRYGKRLAALALAGLLAVGMPTEAIAAQNVNAPVTETEETERTERMEDTDGTETEETEETGTQETESAETEETETQETESAEPEETETQETESAEEGTGAALEMTETEEEPETGETETESEEAKTTETKTAEMTEEPESTETEAEIESGTAEEPITEETEETQDPDAGVMLLSDAADFTYNVTDATAKTIEITGYTGSDTDVVIPGEIDEYTVTSIGDEAFTNCFDLTSIEIPGSVTSIGEWAFSSCWDLTSIEIPGSVTSIGEYAFSWCEGLTSIEIPESVTSIGDSAFNGCIGLISIGIPGSVTSIGEYAFGDCGGLTSIVVEPGNTAYTSGNGNNCIIEKEKGTLIAGCKTTIIPDGVMSIGYGAFSGCRALTSIEIPGSVTSIGNCAFLKCSSLTSIEIPGSVTSIGEWAFDGCSSLTSIEIPGSVTSIGYFAFSGCRGLTSIEIPESVTSIEIGAFGDCGGLTSIVVEPGNTAYTSGNGNNCIIEKENSTLIAGCKTTIIPDGVTSIGDHAFSGCRGLTGIEIPGSVTRISNCAFSECDGLTSIVVEPGNTAYTSGNGNNCIIEKEKGTLIAGCKTTIIPDGVTSIGEDAFRGHRGLTSIEIPGSVTSIGYAAFYDCWDLTSIEIPGSVTSIGDVAIDSSVTIYGESGSYAETWAQQNGNVFIAGKMPQLKDISDCTVTIAATSYTYTGGEIEPDVTVTDGEKSLEKGTDYTVSYEDNVDVGMANVTVTGMGSYTGSIELTFEIVSESDSERNISDCAVSLAAISYTYTGEEIAPDVIVTDGEKSLEKGTDYTVSYEDNVDIGTATVTVTGTGSYTGSQTLTFTITAKNLSACTAALAATSCTYTGTAQTPSVTVTDGTATLKKDTDYTVSYANNTNVGSATVTITGKGNYTGSQTLTFTITAKNLSACTAALAATSCTYTGKAQMPAVTVKDGSKTLKKDTDYTVSYANNTNAGKASVTVKGKGNYTGSQTLNFTIAPKKISACTVSEIAAQFYTGKAQKPSVTVKDGSKTLKKETDYTVSYADNKKAGKATVTVKGKGNYTGSKKVNFMIIKNVSGVKAASAGYNSVKVSWEKVSGVTGYKVYRADSKKGKYKCVKTVKGEKTTSYKDGKLTAGKTYYYQVKPYLGKKEGTASKTVSVKPVPAKAALSSVKNSASKTATVKWKKVSGASGYEIYRATSKNGKYQKVTTVKKGGTTSYKNTKLKKGKTYYYKMRAYRTVNGKKVYGAYSEVKSVKIKK